MPLPAVSPGFFQILAQSRSAWFQSSPLSMTATTTGLGSGPSLAQALSAAPLSPTRLIAHWSSRSEEHTSELQSLMRISYAVFCLQKKNQPHKHILKQLHNTSTFTHL